MHEIADAATQRDTAYPDRARIAEADGQAVRARGSRELRRGQARFGPCRPPGDIDIDGLHVRDIEHDAALGHAVTRTTVSATPNRERQARLPRDRDDLCDVIGVRDSDDHRRTAIDATEHHGPCLIVVSIAGPDHPSVNLRRQARDVERRKNDGAQQQQRCRQYQSQRRHGAARRH